MARPRHGEQIKIQVSVRLDSDLLAKIDELRKGVALSRSLFIESELAARLAQFARPNPTRVVNNAGKQIVGADCAHPRNKRTHLGYASRCGDCGEVVR